MNGIRFKAGLIIFTGLLLTPDSDLGAPVWELTGGPEKVFAAEASEFPEEDPADDTGKDLTLEELEALEDTESQPDTAPEAFPGIKGKFVSKENGPLEVTYDPSSHEFEYGMENGGAFRMNVPIGGITDKAVNIRTSEDTWVTSFYEDGKDALSDDIQYSSVSEAIVAAARKNKKEIRADVTGTYDIRVMSAVINRSDMTMCSNFGSFTIARSDIPVWINSLQAPYGYKIGRMSVNGRTHEVNAERAELKTDGEYEVEFEPVISGLPRWVSHFKRDTTAPSLYFTPPIKNGIMREKVTFRKKEEDSYVRIYLNRKEVSLAEGTAVADGDYRIEVSDAAGNENVYTFRLDTREKAPSGVYIFLGILGAAAAVFVILTAHGRMRII